MVNYYTSKLYNDNRESIIAPMIGCVRKAHSTTLKCADHNEDENDNRIISVNNWNE